MSFASTHGKKAFEMIKVAYGDQVMWPDHCVQNTEDAQIAKAINIPQANLIIRKGFRKDVDGYSAFLEADKKTHSGLASYFKERGIETVFIGGLATDFCVAWTAVDSCHAGFTTYVVEDACRAIDVNGSLAKGVGRHDWSRCQENPVERSGGLNQICGRHIRLAVGTSAL